MNPFAHIVAAGVASAAAPTLADTQDARANRPTFFQKTARFIAEDFAPQICAFRDTKITADLVTRLEALIREAMVDLLRHPQSLREGYSVCICLPETHHAEATLVLTDQSSVARLTYAVTEPLLARGYPSPGDVEVLYSGASGPIAALMRPRSQPLLLVAADSYADRDRMNHLMLQGLLFSSRNPWGFIPGEGAAALVCHWQGQQAGGVPLWGPAVMQEPVGEMAGQDSLSVGLTEALQATVFGLPRAAARIITDCNNSRYRASEAAYAVHRLPQEALSSDVEPVHWPAQMGDVGAAIIPMALACLAGQGGITLICAGARWSGQRASIALS